MTTTTTPVRNFRINTRFTKGAFDDVNQLTLDVEDALANHPVFIKPPVSLTDLETQRLAYQATNTESRKLGTDRTRANAGQTSAGGFPDANSALLPGTGPARFEPAALVGL